MAEKFYFEQTLGQEINRDPVVQKFFTRLNESYGGDLSTNSNAVAGIFKSKENAHAFLNNVTAILEAITVEQGGITDAIMLEDAAARNVAMKVAVDQLLAESTQQGLAALQPISLTAFGFQIRSYVKAVMHRTVKTIQAERPAFKITERKQYVLDLKGNKHYFVDAFNRGSDLTSNIYDRIEFDVNVSSSQYDIFAGEGIDPRNKLSTEMSIVGFTAVEADGITPENPTNLKILTRLRDADLETGRFSVVVKLGSDDATATIMGEIDYENARIATIGTTLPDRVKTVKFSGRLSSEPHLSALTVGFEHQHTQVTIPDGVHIEANPAIEFMDDTARMLGINPLEQYTNSMGTLVEYLEDQYILDHLKSLESQAILTPEFSITPDAAYAYGREEWLKAEFHPFIERVCIRLKAELQIDDCHFRVVGNPMDIRLPNSAGESYIFRRNADMTGTVKVNYDFAVMTSSNTIFYISTDRVQPGKVYINLIPNSIENNIMTINHYRYANYVTNKYRSAKNPALPAVMVSSRYKTKEYVPVMAVVTIKNNYTEYYNNYYNDLTP